MKRALRLMSALALLGLVVALTAGSTNRPDLEVVTGSVSSNGTTITGSFRVTNSGGSTARASRAALVYSTSTSRRVLGTVAVRRLKPGASHRVRVSVPVRPGLPPGHLTVRACADVTDKVDEKRERHNCSEVGALTGGGGSAGGSPDSSGTPASPASPASPGNAPVSSVPTVPVPFEKETVLGLNSGRSDYYVFVPEAYDASHQTPTSLLVWLHGCGGAGADDIDTVSPGGTQSWISVAVGGREGVCWQPAQDGPLVLAALDSVRSHFNIDPRRVVVGGFSSGGDLAYRTAFLNSTRFAGVLAENTTPFRDTGASQSDLLAAATFKFHVAHLAHTGDVEYPIVGVQQEIDTLRSNGFPVDFVERPGLHWDANTNADLRSILLPHMDDPWLAP